MRTFRKSTTGAKKSFENITLKQESWIYVTLMLRTMLCRKIGHAIM